MINEIKQDAEQRMKKSIDSLQSDFAKVRTGRAHPSILEHITIDYYGAATPLSQVASVAVSDPRTLAITPWEKNLVPAIEKAIMTSDLGLNPATSGETIRVPMPALTEERRRDLTKVVKGEAENARVAIRNIRRDANSNIKDLLKEKEITEDQERSAENDIQKLTDKYVEEVEQLLKTKEADLLEV